MKELLSGIGVDSEPDFSHPCQDPVNPHGVSYPDANWDQCGIGVTVIQVITEMIIPLESFLRKIIEAAVGMQFQGSLSRTIPKGEHGIHFIAINIKIIGQKTFLHSDLQIVTGEYLVCICPSHRW